MTIYYTLTFLLLATEMATFCILVTPFPYAIRKKMFHFLSESKVVGKIMYGLKISLIFIVILFVDALQRMMRVSAESDLAKSGQQGGPKDVRTETNIAARKFYAQRNVYLTGFTLFLSLVLTRVFNILLDLIHTQDEYAAFKQSSTGKGGTADQTKQIEELKARLATAEAKERDLETLKKQALSQAKAYDELADRYNEATGQRSSNKKSD